MKSVILALLLAIPCKAEDISVVGPFSGLNDSDSSITLAVGEAQDTLNVEVSADALALKKRMGYGQITTLTTSTEPIHGSVMFKTPTGDNIKIFAHDTYVSKSVNGGVYTNLITSATAGSKWKFCVAAGKAYAFNTSHDIPFSYDGTNVTYYPSIPRASLCAMTVDRMLLAGTTDQPNRLYFSRSGTLTDFVVDINPEDPGFEDLGLSGEKITNIYATQAEWLIFKTNSFTSIQGTNQFDLVPSVISERVGMIDPYAITDSEGIVYFKASDGRIWGYSSGTLTELSKKIDGFISLITKDAISSAEYTTKAQFDSGTYYASTGNITAGSVEPILETYDDTDFSNGSFDNVKVVSGNLVLISTPPFYFKNMGAENGDIQGWSSTYASTTTTGTPVWGTYQLRDKDADDDDVASWNIVKNGGQTIYSGTAGTYCMDGTTNGVITNQINFRCYNGSITRNIASGHLKSGAFCLSAKTGCYFDMQEPGVSSGTYVSENIELDFAYPHIGYLISTTTINQGNDVSFYVRHSSISGGAYSAWVATTDYFIITSTDTIWQYKVAVYTSSATHPSVSGVYLAFKSTGYWETPELSMGGMNSWGVFNTDVTTNGLASWTYAIYTSSYAGGTALANAEAITDGVAITASTGTYSKIRATNSFYSATETVKLDNIYYSWGRTPDKMANAFEYKGDIYFAVPYNNSLSNNRLLKFDTKTAGWNIFDIPLNSPIVDDYVYFGSPTGASLYQYPYGDNDNGSAINSYWKSKNFIGSNPYVEKKFNKMSIIAGSDFGSSLDVTYTMDTSTSTMYTIALTSTTADFVRNNRALPFGDTGTFFNMKIGNNAANQPWSFFGANVEYSNEPWRVMGD